VVITVAKVAEVAVVEIVCVPEVAGAVTMPEGTVMLNVFRSPTI
jgi:hypothetical protein